MSFGSLSRKTSSRTLACSAGTKKKPSKLMAKELRCKGTLRAQVPVACVVCSPPLQSPPPSPPPQLTVLVFRLSGFFTDSTWARWSIFTRGEPADASRLGWPCRLARCGGLQRESGAPASVQSGACGGPQCADWRLRLASEHGASGAQRACRAAPAAGYAVECRAALPAAGYTARRAAPAAGWRVAGWRAAERATRRRHRATARRAAPAAHGLAGWRAAEGAERRLRRATGTACRAAPAAGYKAHRAAPAAGYKVATRRTER